MFRPFVSNIVLVVFVLVQIKYLRLQVHAQDDAGDLIDAFKAAYAYSPFGKQLTAKQPPVPVSKYIGASLSAFHSNPSSPITTEQKFKHETSDDELDPDNIAQKPIAIVNTNLHSYPATSRYSNSRTLHYSPSNQNAANQKVALHQPTNNNAERIALSSKNHSNNKLSFMANNQGRLEYIRLPDEATSYQLFTSSKVTSPNAKQRMPTKSDRGHSRVVNTREDCNLIDNIEKQQTPNQPLPLSISVVKNDSQFPQFARNVNYLSDDLPVEYLPELVEDNNDNNTYNIDRNQVNQFVQKNNLLNIQNKAKNVLENFILQLDQLRSMAKLELEKM